MEQAKKNRAALLLELAERRQERSQAREALGTSYYRMKTILDSLVEGVAQYDRAGVIQAANASARRILPQADLQELELLSVNEEGLPWPAGRHPVTRALKEGLACTGLVLGIRKRGGPLAWVSLNATPLLYQAREPWGVVVSLTDISERRQVQRRREVLADLLQMAHQAVSIPNLAQDMANRLALWSGCGAVAISIQEGPALRCHPTQGFPEPCPGAVWPRQALCCNRASLYRASGDPDARALGELARLGFESVAFLPLALGEARGGLLQLLDPRPGCFDELTQAALEEVAGITGHLLAKALAEMGLRERAEALARSQALLTQAQALAGLGSWELDLASAQRNWSPANYGHWDCDPGQPIPPFEVLVQKVHPQDQPAFRTFMESLGSARETMEQELRLISPAGATRHLFLQAIPLTGALDPPGRILGATVDITSRKLSELALRNMDKLSAKGQMAAYIAHEINNPLAGIRNAFLLLEGAIPSEHPHRPFVPMINREIDRIASIIRTMYHIYRPGPGATRKLVLQEVFHDLDSLLAPKCRGRSTRIAFDGTGMLEEAILNEGFFRQVLFNLLQNAVEASPPGGVVQVAARSGQGHLEVTVGDSGAGIPPALSEKIFQSGFTTKLDSEINGLGLGLATCRSLVESMGGTLVFQNRPTSPGTVFTVRLPI